uniref:Uncharacterized protein n=1 Tax=Photinus pyralis TaxID=7054 RepID=A0A1Y1N0U9_PHOPY
MCLEDGAADYTNFEDRLLSFHSWVGVPSAVELANAGFFYTHSGDTVECFYCKVRINKWEASDVPLAEHLRWSSRCRYARLLNRMACLKINETEKTYCVCGCSPGAHLI